MKNLNDQIEEREKNLGASSNYLEKSTRDQALEWWYKLPITKQAVLYEEYFGADYRNSFFEDEIEEIWRKETQPIFGDLTKSDLQEDLKENFELRKLNQKQFKEFNPELFKAYIDKFSDEDKFKIWELMFDIIPDDKKWDNINHNSPFYLHVCRAYNAGKQQMKNEYYQYSNHQSSQEYYESEFN